MDHAITTEKECNIKLNEKEGDFLWQFLYHLDECFHQLKPLFTSLIDKKELSDKIFTQMYDENGDLR